MEEAMMEAVAERDVGEARRECRMSGKGRARETGTCEMRADAAKAGACAHSAEMHPTSHGMHAASHAMHSHPATTHAAMTTKATTASTSRER